MNKYLLSGLFLLNVLFLFGQKENGIRRMAYNSKVTENIAQLCPLLGGPVSVHRARSLAKFFNLSFTLPEKCMEEKGKKRSVEAITRVLNQFKIYPNPAKNQLKIDYSGKDLEAPLLVELRNLTGQLVATRQLKSDNPSTFLFLGKQPSGIYILTISGDQKILATEKIVIQK